MIKRFVILILMVTALQSRAETYYVTPRGNDSNDGLDTVSTHAWLTWKHGIESISAHDTLYIRGGTYTPANDTERSAYAYIDAITSSREAPLCILAYPSDYADGNIPTLDCRNQVASAAGYNNAIEIINSHYIKFKGLTVCNVRQDQRALNLETGGEYGHKAPGFTASDCTNLTFEECTAHHCGGAGFNILNYSETIIDTTIFRNCDAYSNADSLSTYTLDEGVTWLRQAGNGADGFFLQVWDNFTANYSLVEGCRAWENTDDGINLDQACLTVMRNCWAFNGGDPNLDHSEGNGFKIGDPPPHDPDWISRITHNNIAANNMGSGYDPNNGLGDEWPRAWTYNNFSYNNYIGYLIQNCSEDQISDTANVYKNNISYLDSPYVFFDIPLAQESYTNYITSSCTWLSAYDGGNYAGTIANPAYSVSDADFVSLDVSELQRSRQSDGSLPEVDFGKLAGGSDLIDGGETDYRFVGMGMTYNGEAPDLGWYESGEYLPEPEETATPIINGLQLIIHNGIIVKIL